MERRLVAMAAAWLISDPTLLAFVVNAQCNDTAATPFTSLTALQCKCPSAPFRRAVVSQLTMADGSSALTIDCSSRGLDDKAMQAIVANIPPTTPLDVLVLDGN